MNGDDFIMVRVKVSDFITFLQFKVCLVWDLGREVVWILNLKVYFSI